MKKFFQEFKAFISRGNVMDLAVGVIISAERRFRARFICWEIIIWTTARFCPLW